MGLVMKIVINDPLITLRSLLSRKRMISKNKYTEGHQWFQRDMLPLETLRV
jgi:hypothetical protein